MVTIEDRAAKILAAACGYGDPLPLAGLEEQPHREWDSGADELEPEDGSIRVAERGNAIQQAGRAISQNRRQKPRWFLALSPERQAEVLRWSDAHPLQTKRGEIGQQRQWRRVFGRMVTPRGPKFDNVIVAVVDAERDARRVESARTRAVAQVWVAIEACKCPQSCLELEMLRVYALEDEDAGRRVLNYAVKAGHRREIALNALIYRVMFPNSRKLHHSIAARALEIGIGKLKYAILEQAATDLLRMWLHDACVKFMSALTRPVTADDFPPRSRNIPDPENTSERLYV